MIARVCLIAVLITVSFSAGAAEGLITTQSPHSVADSMDRLEVIVKEKGLTVFARIDHAAGARSIDQSLRPTQLLIFGNPKGGTPFMACAQMVGIDLPLKVLAWEDQAGQVWLGYNDPAWIASRHNTPECLVAEKLASALQGFVQSAVAR
ncbi:MAG: hypothetical protein CVV16_06370 [Gammaproteobacteria bacterium HGW-Gammaproteobacteria-6]|nr:MAG: hypothetical protein CVV16_06370 [Gammaproteobacteria bacterium HGW-Gammaproteobacteria-6]